jgi:hypothetical protein
MKKVILLIFSMLILISYTFAQKEKDDAQERTNFDGTWILEKVENPPNSFLPIEIKDYENYFLVISFDGDEFKIKKTLEYKKEFFNYEIILYTDERGEKKPKPYG